MYQSTQVETQALSCPAHTPSGSIYQQRTYDLYSDGTRQNYSAWQVTNNCFNGTPAIGNLSRTIAEDASDSIVLSVSDDGPGPYIFQIVNGPANGIASIVGATLNFSPKADWNGATGLTYRVMDGAGSWSNVATVSITVSAVNDAPVSQAKTLIVDEDTSGTVTLSATDIDSPVPTVFQVVSTPNAAHGTASINGSTLTFRPA
ncbi:hypothetical protein KZ843_12370, partial [Pseudomonas aeruginosa]